MTKVVTAFTNTTFISIASCFLVLKKCIFALSKITSLVKKSVIIVAGGSGSRMSSDIPKQFLLIGNRPILMHTIKRFSDYEKTIQIILVLPSFQQLFWQSLCQKYEFTIPHTIANGGETRFHSVKNGMEFISDDCIVAIHDGVRPLVSKETIERCFEIAAKKGNAIPAIEVVDSLRFVDKNENKSVSRNNYRLIQTPQVFKSSFIKKAFEQEYIPSFTDDASVLEKMGETLFLVEGNKENIKITTPYDLLIANAILNANNF